MRPKVEVLFLKALIVECLSELLHKLICLFIHILVVKKLFAFKYLPFSIHTQPILFPKILSPTTRVWKVNQYSNLCPYVKLFNLNHSVKRFCNKLWCNSTQHLNRIVFIFFFIIIITCLILLFVVISKGLVLFLSWRQFN